MTERTGSRFTVLVGGTLTPTARLLRQVAGTRAIAADAGMAHADVLGLSVELWVGDFDSADAGLIARHADVPREVLSPDKDKTDGELAIDAALARGASAIVLAGGLGGQTDHALGHFMLAVRLRRAGLPILVTSGEEEAHPLVAGETLLDLPAGSRLSLVALSDLAGLDLEGVRWPLAGRTVALGSTLTLSNVAHGPVRIRLGAGQAMAIAYPREI
ncbi:MAG: thiamine diphosphokinase [Hyphomicrobiaceae bacterium]